MVSLACPPHPSASAATPERIRQVSGGPRPWQRPERSSHSVPAPFRSEAGPAGSPGPDDARGRAAAAAAIPPRSQLGPSPRFSRVTFRARAQPITRPGASVTGSLFPPANRWAGKSAAAPLGAGPGGRGRAAAAVLLGRSRAHGPGRGGDWSGAAGMGGGKGGAPGQVWRAVSVGGLRGPIPWQRSGVGAPGGLKGSWDSGSWLPFPGWGGEAPSSAADRTWSQLADWEGTPVSCCRRPRGDRRAGGVGTARPLWRWRDCQGRRPV